MQRVLAEDGVLWTLLRSLSDISDATDRPTLPKHTETGSTQPPVGVGGEQLPVATRFNYRVVVGVEEAAVSLPPGLCLSVLSRPA